MCGGYKIEIFIAHLRVKTTTAVYQCLHLCTHRVEINRSGHNNGICSHHFVYYSGSIIFLRTRFVMNTACTATGAILNSFVA